MKSAWLKTIETEKVTTVHLILVSKVPFFQECTHASFNGSFKKYIQWNPGLTICQGDVKSYFVKPGYRYTGFPGITIF